MTAATHTLTTDPLALRVENDGLICKLARDGQRFIAATCDDHVSLAQPIPTPAMLAFARAVVEQCGWEDIGTAPKMERVWVSGHNGWNGLAIAATQDGDGDWTDDSDSPCFPTVWQPLPKGPR